MRVMVFARCPFCNLVTTLCEERGPSSHLPFVPCGDHKHRTAVPNDPGLSAADREDEEQEHFVRGLLKKVRKTRGGANFYGLGT
jgi:hypothetical protein